MINYEEELKKFYPSPEIDDFADSIYHQDYTDIVDILIKTVKETQETEEEQR